MSTLNVATIKNGATANITLDTAGNATVGNTLAMGSSFLRNRIINGDMRIDQRNAGASVTPATNDYTLDRWQWSLSQASKLTVQQSTDAPTTFSYSLLATVAATVASLGATDYFTVRTKIEGFNFADFSFGSASAKTLTLSFWVKSSVTGTFGGVMANSGYARSYPFTYFISAANTWEYKTLTIVGDTSGTWLTTNGIGAIVEFGLGVGTTYSGTANNTWQSAGYDSANGATNLLATSSATWRITGVQLEVGSVATPFERRQYGQELALCQRYYYRLTTTAASQIFCNAYVANATLAIGLGHFPVTVRTAPSALEQTGTATDYTIRWQTTTTTCSAVPTFSSATIDGWSVIFTVASGLTAGNAAVLRSASAGPYLGFSAEL